MNGRSIISSAYLIIILVHYKLYTREEEKTDRSKSERPREEMKRGLNERHACMMSCHAP